MIQKFTHGDDVRSLFIGGPWDGQRVSVELEQTIIVGDEIGSAFNSETTTRSTYYVYTLVIFGEQEKFPVYLFADLTVDDFLGRVLNNYANE